MAFPTTPTNGQTTTVNGISYTYDSSSNSWRRSAPATYTYGNDSATSRTANAAFAAANTKTTLGKSIAMTIVFGG